MTNPLPLGQPRLLRDLSPLDLATMALKSKYKRTKERLKRRLGVSSDNASSTSLPDAIQESDSPAPPTSSRAAQSSSALSQLPSGHAQSPTNAGASSHDPARLAPPIVPTAISSTSLSDVQSPASAVSAALAHATAASTEVNVEPQSTRDTTWSGLKKLLRVVESSSEVFPPLGAAVNGLSQCVDIFDRASKGRKDYLELLVKLNSILEDLSEHLGSVTSPTMTKSMMNLWMGINQELELIKQRTSRSTVQRYMDAVNDSDEIFDCYRRIGDHLARLTLNANLSIWGTVDDMKTDSLLRQLAPALSAVYDSAKSGMVQRRECTPGTRVPEISKLLAWTTDQNSEGIYWMNGMAGTGKTTISYSLCTELENKAMLGASFFCSRLIPECRDANLILPAISYQLARVSVPFRCALSKVLEAEPDMHARVMRKQFDSLIAKPLSEVKHALPTDFVVVIDALDECEAEDSIGEILDVLLSQPAGSSLPIRFLISSRPEPEIYSRMMGRVGDKLESRLVLHDLDKDAVRNDIETYLRTELEGMGFTSSQIVALVEQSGSLFVFASTAVRHIKDGHRIKQHEKRLKMVLGLVPAMPNSKGRDIDGLYASILKAAFESEYLDDADKEMMKTILDTAVCAQEPMTVIGLAGLLANPNVEEVDGLLRPLCSVLNIAETTGIVTMLHASFADFMFDQQRSSSFYCNPGTTHSRMATECFNAIKNNELQFNICRLKSSYQLDEEVRNLTERVEQAVSPHLLYGCRHWMAHLELGGEGEIHSQPLYEFLSTRLLLWMEVLNLKKLTQIGPRLMYRAEKWSRRHYYSAEIIELVHDAWRFVTTFASHAISQSTPHIYMSMLPLWPEHSPVAIHYTKQIRGMFAAQGTALTKRPVALVSTWKFHSRIHSACTSPNNTLVAFAIDESIYAVDEITGQIALGPLEHNDTVWSVNLSPDSTLIASGSADAAVRIWSTHNGQLTIGPLTGHSGEVNTVCFTPDGSRVVSGSDDRTIRVWDIRSGLAVTGPMKGHERGVLSVNISPDGTRIVSCSSDATVRVWDLNSGDLVFGPLRGHSERVLSVCFSPDSARIVSCSSDKTLKIWNAQAEQTTPVTLEGHNGPVYSAAFSSDGKHLVSGSWDNTMRLWDVEDSAKLLRVLEGHTNTVSSIAWTSNDSTIISSSWDKTIRVWDVLSLDPTGTALEGHHRLVTSISYSHDGSRIVSGSQDQNICVWDAQSGRILTGPLKGHTGSIYWVLFSPDDAQIASTAEDNTVRLWNAQTGAPIGQPFIRQDKVHSILFSPDGDLIVATASQNSFSIWNASNGLMIINPLTQHTAPICAISFSSDATHVATASEDTTILVWNAQSGELISQPFKGHTDKVYKVCLSSSGGYIASSTEGKVLRIWDVQSGQSIAESLEGNYGWTNSMSFSPDSMHLVSCAIPKAIRFWSTQSGRIIGSPLTGHTEWVCSVAFSPSGQHIVSGSYDRAIRFWDVSDMFGAQEPKRSTAHASSNDSTISNRDSPSPWELQDDGWVVDSQSRLLAWLPPDLHVALLRPRNTLLISTRGSLQLDFENAVLGELWGQCYKGLN